MPYKATGKPAGRPRKDGLPAGSKPEQAKKEERHEIPARPGNEIPMFDGPCCTVCYEDGWPKGWSSFACEHGVFARRL